jgi:hypothetical protein
MSVTVNKPGEHDAALAIKLAEAALVLLEPGMTQDFTFGTGGNDLSTCTEHGRFFNQPKIIEKRSAARCGFAAKGEKLADVGQKKIGRLIALSQLCPLVIGILTPVLSANFAASL